MATLPILSPDQEKAAALQAFIDRRAANKGRKPIDNAKLHAGEPMRFVCKPCNGDIEVDEDYRPPRPEYCPECTKLKKNKWLDEFLRHVQKNS